MAYDLASYYANSISNGSNGLTKSILDQLMRDNRFNSVTKITLPFEYGTGDVSKEIIGYDEVGNPIYSSPTLVTNDEFIAAMAKMHDRNTDTTLRGAGTNVIENTSTGNIVQFTSNGRIKAIIDETGRFTGSIRLENIEDLDKLTLNTSNFYTKANVNTLLAGKLTRTDIIGSNDKIKSDLLDVDIVREVELRDHDVNAIKHITADERKSWNSKYDKPNGGINFDDLNTSVSSMIRDAAPQNMLDSHTGNDNIHVTSSDKSRWNVKYDKPTTGIPSTDMSEAVQTILNTAVSNAIFNYHATDSNKHITSIERDNWNKKYTLPGNGMPEKDLEQSIKDKLNNATPNTDFYSHVDNTVAHVTAVERDKWNVKYDKPANGIPELDLEKNFTDKVASLATSASLTAHENDNIKHITGDERSAWNSKYNKPDGGIPESDLVSSLQNKISNMTNVTDFNDHATDSTKHITAEERSAWNAKYGKPVSGIPELDLEKEFRDKVASLATSASLTAHTSDTDIHVTTANKNAWNAKYDKPTDGIDVDDMSDKVKASLAQVESNKTNINAHIVDTDIHVTTANKNAWNAKYDKPTDGIPESDLNASIQTNLTKINTHTSDTDIHVTTSDKSKWDGQYTKPATGIPTIDLSDEVTKVLTNATTHMANNDIHVTAAKTAEWDAKYTKPADGISKAELHADLQILLDSIKAYMDAHPDEPIA